MSSMRLAFSSDGVRPLSSLREGTHATIVEVRAADGRTVTTRSGIVAPDEPNDIELAAARIDANGMLIAVVRNHSPIPLRGAVVVAAREPAAPYTLLARAEVALDVAAGGSQEIPVGHVGAADLARMQIALSTDAIDDANLGNDVLRS